MPKGKKGPLFHPGNTALHDCAESGSLDILRLLLEHGARVERDAYGLTPLLAAAVTGHAPVVEFLSSLPDCPREQRVEALELLGATFVDKKRDSPRALALWRRQVAFMAISMQLHSGSFFDVAAQI